jgi:hypothetical protein
MSNDEYQQRRHFQVNPADLCARLQKQYNNTPDHILNPAPVINVTPEMKERIDKLQKQWDDKY